MGPGRGELTRPRRDCCGPVGDRPGRDDRDRTLGEGKAAGTPKRTFGFHPLLAFVDHGAEGTGEPLSLLLRPGNAGSNTAADHITAAKDALAQVPGVNPSRPGKKILTRADGAGGTKEFTSWLARRGVQYSVGFTLPAHTPDLLAKIPQDVWAPAYDAEGKVRPARTSPNSPTCSI